jgi:hypothetical protein
MFNDGIKSKGKQKSRKNQEIFRIQVIAKIKKGFDGCEKQGKMDIRGMLRSYCWQGKFEILICQMDDYNQ